MMNLEAVLLFLIFFVRNRILKSRAAPIRLLASQAFAIVLPITLSILSFVTLEGHAPFHLLSSFVFFVGCILYFFLGDNLAGACGFAVSTLSQVPSWLSPVLFFAHMVAMWKGRAIGSMQLLTIGTLLQYGVAFVVFLKIAVFWNDLPPQSVKLNKQMADR
jgi:hypothetical protein